MLYEFAQTAPPTQLLGSVEGTEHAAPIAMAPEALQNAVVSLLSGKQF